MCIYICRDRYISMFADLAEHFWCEHVHFDPPKLPRRGTRKTNLSGCLGLSWAQDLQAKPRESDQHVQIYLFTGFCYFSCDKTSGYWVPFSTPRVNWTWIGSGSFHFLVIPKHRSGYDLLNNYRVAAAGQVPVTITVSRWLESGMRLSTINPLIWVYPLVI